MARKSDPEPIRIRYVRYVNAEGKQVPKTDPEARKQVVLSETWYVRLDGNRISLGTEEKAEAWKRLRDILKDRAMAQLGIAPQAVADATRPLAEHLDDWKRALVDKGTTARPIDEAVSHLSILAELAGWRKLADIGTDSALAALASLRQCGRVALAAHGISPATSNRYLQHLKQFVRWCLEERRLAENPIASMKPVRAAGDVRHARRPPTDLEVARLLEYLLAGHARRRSGMDGPTRALAYRLVMATGLRSGELRSLTRQSFDLDSATVTVRGAYTKNGRTARQPLPGWLVLELRRHFEAGGSCWEQFPPRRAGRILAADLDAAGVAYRLETADGPRYVDFHSLRHYYATQLVASGADIGTVMSLGRWATADLALRVYNHAQEELRRQAVETIRLPLSCSSVAEAKDDAEGQPKNGREVG